MKPLRVRRNQSRRRRRAVGAPWEAGAALCCVCCGGEGANERKWLQMKLAGCEVLFSPARGNEQAPATDWRNWSPVGPEPSPLSAVRCAHHMWRRQEMHTYLLTDLLGGRLTALAHALTFIRLKKSPGLNAGGLLFIPPCRGAGPAPISHSGSMPSCACIVSCCSRETDDGAQYWQ